MVRSFIAFDPPPQGAAPLPLFNDMFAYLDFKNMVRSNIYGGDSLVG